MLGSGASDVEKLQHDVIQALAVEVQRHVIDGCDVARLDHGPLTDVAEERDLAANLLRERLLRPAQQHVGLNADFEQALDAVLGRLGFDFFRGFDVRDQGEMDEDAVVGAFFVAHLATRLQKREPFDIAGGAADLGDDDIDVAVRAGRTDARLDLVGDVGHHLHGLAQVAAGALFLDHRLIDLPRGHTVIAGETLVEEALVVSEVEVGLTAVVGDEHFAVLVRAHGAGSTLR
jgi:hypothetical protein